MDPERIADIALRRDRFKPQASSGAVPARDSPGILTIDQWRVADGALVDFAELRHCIGVIP